MKKKLLLATMAAVAVLSSSISVCAAPQYLMPDGTVFDPEWYLEQNPDLASWPLGTSEDALWQHYQMYGKAETRSAYDAAHYDPANAIPWQGTAADQTSSQPAADQTPANDPENIYAVEGESYRFPSIHNEQYNYQDCMVNITFNKGEVDEEDSYFANYLAPYTLPGYEWRKIDVSATTDAAVPGITGWDIGAIDLSKGDFRRIQCLDHDDNITNFESLWDYMDENGWVLHAATFTVSQNGTEYPNCQIFETWEWGFNDISRFSWYELVPQGFSGGLYAGYRGAMLQDGKVVSNTSSPYIWFEF